MFHRAEDLKVRAAAFEWLGQQVSLHPTAPTTTPSLPRRASQRPTGELLAARHERFVDLEAAS